MSLRLRILILLIAFAGVAAAVVAGVAMIEARSALAERITSEARTTATRVSHEVDTALLDAATALDRQLVHDEVFEFVLFRPTDEETEYHAATNRVTVFLTRFRESCPVFADVVCLQDQTVFASSVTPGHESPFTPGARDALLAGLPAIADHATGATGVLPPSSLARIGTITGHPSYHGRVLALRVDSRVGDQRFSLIGLIEWETLAAMLPDIRIGDEPQGPSRVCRVTGTDGALLYLTPGVDPSELSTGMLAREVQSTTGWHYEVLVDGSIAFAPVTSLVTVVLLVLGGVFALAVVASSYFARWLADPVTTAMQARTMELTRALKARDTFLAGMSHELRTPLNGMLMLAQVLQERTWGDLTDRQEQCVRKILEAGGHLLELINDILDLARHDAGRLALDCESIDASAVCRAATRMVEEAARKKRIHIATHLPPSLPIVADRRRLIQILVNLLSNAVKFTAPGGRVELSVTTRDDHAEFSVRDTGIGISQEDIRNRLFHPFVQLDDALSRALEGAGLGLTLVKRLAEMHGGHVHVESEEGVGSCFTVLVPLRQPETVTDATPVVRDTTPAPTGPDGPPPHSEPAMRPLLLVEDNDANREILFDYLTSRGFRVETASDGPEAVRRLQSGSFGLVLLDIQLPGLDGIEVLNRIRSQPSTRTLPVVGLSAHALPRFREQFLAAGGDTFLTKPVSLSLLGETIQRMLDRREPSLSPDSDPGIGKAQ